MRKAYKSRTLPNSFQSWPFAAPLRTPSAAPSVFTMVAMMQTDVVSDSSYAGTSAMLKQEESGVGIMRLRQLSNLEVLEVFDLRVPNRGDDI